MKKSHKTLTYSILAIIIGINLIAFNHAYLFTHFSDSHSEKTKKPEELSIPEKIGVLFWGASVPKPVNKKSPEAPFETIYFEGNGQLEGWLIPVEGHNGVVILFHGYASSKSSLLPYAAEFNKLGYSAFLVDLSGNGGSAGQTTTLGFRESRDVAAAFALMKNRFPDDKLVLFGVSMGAVSIMKAVADFEISPDQIIIESPFGSMRDAVYQRFSAMNVPAFPFADLLLFYGGLQSGFNAFAHRPVEYARSISTKTLLSHGAKDRRVSRAEIDEIFENLEGEKQLAVFENSGHEVFLKKDSTAWVAVVSSFLAGLSKKTPLKN